MNLDKIIRSLDLSKSDARDKTIESIIEYVLYCVNENITADNLNQYIQMELSIELYKTELDEALNKLLDEGHINRDINKNHYSLSDERKIEIRKIELSNDEAKELRFKNFEVAIKKYSSRPLTDGEIKSIWDTLTDYIYECYLVHGKNALYVFSGRRELTDNENDLTIILNKYQKHFTDNDLANAFREYINNFSAEVSSETLDYLLTLANKAEAFFALGLSKEEYALIYNDIVFDWTIFVDTNFLYSILDLHSHPENEACKALVEIGVQLDIKFRYLAITLQELQNKSKDFDAQIPQNLQRSQIRALIESDQLDSFSMRYFEKKLIDMDNTPHPIDVVGHSMNNLKNRGIEIFRTTFEKLSDADDYRKDEESKYNTFLNFLDDQRIEKGIKIKGAKDPKQVSHDIFLREAILYMRSAKIGSINDVKYMGVTLDKRLIKFDNYMVMKKKDGVNIPVFFYPSILLKKLLKYAPVKSDDYSRAFIRAISTPALDGNSYTSKIAIRSVKYFHNMGISDEKMILNCIKDEMFLTKFKDLENNAVLLDEFVESEIQKNYKKLSDELDEYENLVSKKNDLIKSIHNDSISNLEENEKLKVDVEDLKNAMKVYSATIKKFKAPTNHTKEITQLTLDDERRSQQQEDVNSRIIHENQTLSKKLDLAQAQSFIIWRNQSLIYLLPIAFSLILIAMVFFWQNQPWNFVSDVVKWAEKLSDLRKELIKGITAAVLGATVVQPARIIYKRFYNKSVKKDFLEQLAGK